MLPVKRAAWLAQNWPEESVQRAGLCRQDLSACPTATGICAVQCICADMLAMGKEQDVIGRAGLQVTEKRNPILPH